MLVEVEPDPVSMITHQQGAEFQTALTVGLGWHRQLHEVPLEVRLHSQRHPRTSATTAHCTSLQEAEEALYGTAGANP